MVCQTIKKGVDCIFMKKTGCNYNGGRCHPIVDQCNGCSKTLEFPSGLYCTSFTEPAAKWNGKSCPLGTHLKKETQENGQKRLNPLKASKRSMGKRA